MELYKKEDDSSLSVSIGLCRCYIRLGQQTNAVRYLNSIIHSEMTHSDYSVFVEAFLMMSHISMKDNNYIDAEKYIQKALDLDKSSGKSWELYGIILEKRKSFIEAAESFQKAWDISSHNNLAIGYKLAQNYLIAKNPVEAIKVSRMIFTQRPNYPKLKESVFIPAIKDLRP